MKVNAAYKNKFENVYSNLGYTFSALLFFQCYTTLCVTVQLILLRVGEHMEVTFSLVLINEKWRIRTKYR